MRRIVEFAPLFSNVLRAATDRVTVVSGEDALEDLLYQEPRLVFALNHGPAHAPVIPIAALGQRLLARGGGGRRAVGITFRGLYLIPGLRQVVSYLTQADEPPSFDELCRGFESGRFDSVVLMPEGANCAFGDPRGIQEFASPRFAELATRFGAPVVLCVHAGLEAWATTVAAPRALLDAPWLSLLPYDLGRSLQRSGVLAVPIGAPRIPELRLAFAVHRPTLSAEAFAALDDDARRTFVAEEAARVRATMRAMHASIGGASTAATERHASEPSAPSRTHPMSDPEAVSGPS